MDVAFLRIGIDLQIDEAFAESFETSSAPISMPTSSRSPSSTMSLIWPTRGGGGNVHFATFRFCAAPAVLARFRPCLRSHRDVPARRRQKPRRDPAACRRAPTRTRMRQAVIDPFPFDAAVVAACHADAARRGKQRPVIERRDRADEYALQRAMLHGPALFGACKDGNAIHRAHSDGTRTGSQRAEYACRRSREGS